MMNENEGGIFNPMRGFTPGDIQGDSIIARTPLPNAITVSTIKANDLGFETAILHAGHAHAVERYETLQDAQAGHDKWTKKARLWQGEVSFTKLGYPGVREDEVITIKIGDMN